MLKYWGIIAGIRIDIKERLYKIQFKQQFKTGIEWKAEK